MRETLRVSFEIKALGSREFEGHGSVFRNVDLGGDVVVPGAFKRTLAAHKKSGRLPQMFWMHQPDKVPGKWTHMEEDDKGLYTRGVLADTDLGNEMHTLLKLDAVRGLSIGYKTREADFDNDGNRLLKEVDLWEVSLVSLAMNPLAEVEAVKSRLSRDGVYVPDVREFEQFLRSNGYTRKFAEYATARIFRDPAFRGEPGGYRGEPDDDHDPDVQAALEAARKQIDRVLTDSLHR